MIRSVRLTQSALVTVLSAAYFAHVFQFTAGGVPTAGLGDWIDPYFINYLLEHWYSSIRHLDDPSSPPMYFPERGTLGYSHGLVLYAPIYSALRPWLDPFRAETATAFLVMAGGTVAFYAVLRTFVRSSFVEALALTALFATSANIVSGETGVWLQRASVYLVPPAIWLVLTSMRMRDAWPRWLTGWFAGFVSLLLFTQDFYTAAFAVLVGALQFAGTLRAIVGWVASAWISPHLGASDLIRHAKRPSKAWLLVAGLAGAWGAFIWLYPIGRVELGPLRVSAENYRRPFLVAVVAVSWYVARRWQLARRVHEFVTRIRPGPFALAVGIGALSGVAVFGWIYFPIYLEGRTFPPEHILNASQAVDPSSWRSIGDAFWSLLPFTSTRAFWLVAVIAALSVLPRTGVPPAIRRHALWSLVVAAVVIALPLKVGDVSVWRVAIGWAPGFSSIRDPRRIIYLYELGVAAAAALFLASLPSRSPVRWATTAVVLLLLATGWNRHVFAYDRPIATFDQWVRRPLTIDPSCRSFYVKGASQGYMARSGHMWSLYAVDAMFIALERGIPTLNGYSAWTPDYWELANPQEDTYPQRVASWIARRGLTGVCELDIDARTMTLARP